MDENRSEQNTSENTSPASYGTSSGLFGETDRDSGEYHFHSGYTHQVYSNAHYIREDESTVPPKYYRPAASEKTVDPVPGNAKKKSGVGFILVLVLCFLSALIGGGVAGILTMRHLTGSGMAVFPAETEAGTVEEDQMTGSGEENAADLDVRNDQLTESEPPKEPVLTASEIYDRACSQVVSIATDVVTVDRYGNQTPSVISGSGFIVSVDGYIITNFHVVQHAVDVGISVSITTYDGTVHKGSIIGYDYENDLAVVKIDADGFSPCSLGDSDTISVGDDVYAVGNPYGVLEFTMSTGHVSALNRLIATDENEENATEMFQIDAAVYSGNSGGPVYDAYGKVIGIVSAKYLEEGMEGIGFAIPINKALPVVYELLDKGYVGGRASISMAFDENYNTVLSRYYRLPEGAYISSVFRGGCAEKAGLRAGDILMKIGNYSVDSYSDVPPALRHFKAGDSTEIVIFRDGTLYSAKVTLDEALPDAETDSIVAYSARFA